VSCADGLNPACSPSPAIDSRRLRAANGSEIHSSTGASPQCSLRGFVPLPG
jgi:hypothetical protein